MKIYKIIKFAVFFLLGLSVFFLKGIYVENLKYFIGALITMYGVDSVITFILEKDERRPITLCKAIVDLILGLSTLLSFNEYSTICIIWAVWSIMRESDELDEAYELFREGIPCALTTIESVVAIVFSIMLIREPGEHHAMTHMYLLVIELWTTVMFPHLRWVYIKYVKKQKAE